LYIVIIGLSGFTVVSILSHKQHHCRENIFEHKIFVLISATFFSKPFLIPRQIQQNIITHVRRFSCKVPLIIFQISMKLEFSRQIFKTAQISNFMNIVPVRADLFQADGQT